jgi:putative SOS response-associated peptidase YedK
VIIPPDKVEEWLTNDDKDFLNDCMAPPDDQHFDIKKVSGYVNNSRHEGPECLTEI